MLRRQLEQAEERTAVARRLSGSVLGVLSALGQQAEPSTEEFLSLIEVMIAMDRKFPPNSLSRWLGSGRSGWRDSPRRSSRSYSGTARRRWPYSARRSRPNSTATGNTRSARTDSGA